MACLQDGFSAQDPQEQAILQDALEDICLVVDLTCVDLHTHTPVGHSRHELTKISKLMVQECASYAQKVENYKLRVLSSLS